MSFFSSPEDLHFTLALLWTAIGFSSYYFLAKYGSGKFIERLTGLDPLAGKVINQRFLGFLFLGLIAVGIILLLPNVTPGAYGLGFVFKTAPPWWAYALIPVIIFLGYFPAQKASNLALYPQIRILRWNKQLILISALSWIIFLVGYEFLFRGFLLYASMEVLNPASAIALNSAIYALAHIYKGPGETFGAIPVGIILCLLTLQTGNIWSAVIIHSLMALSNEWFSLRAHPEMQVSTMKA